MSYIIANPQNISTLPSDSYKNCLDKGEYFEALLAADLNRHGIAAYRPKQDKLPDNLLRKHQIDILVPITMVKRICIEVKARHTPWEYHDVLVGNIAKWDNKKHTNYVVVICQETNDTRIAKVDLERWSRRKMKYEMSYTVPRFKFSPLDAFIDAYKDRYPLMLTR